MILTKLTCHLTAVGLCPGTRLCKTGVPNLSLTTYPHSISTERHIPLQNFKRWTCTPKFFSDKIFFM